MEGSTVYFTDFRCPVGTSLTDKLRHINIVGMNPSMMDRLINGVDFELLSVFQQNIDDMPLEQKRAAIRTVVRKVIWDGVNAHIVLFGADEEEIEMPDITPLLTEQEEALEPFADVDYEEDLENEAESESASMTPWREDSK